MPRTKSAMVDTVLGSTERLNVHVCPGLVKAAVSGRLNPLSALPSPAPFFGSECMSSEHLGPFLTSAGVAAKLTANGKRCAERTPIEWARRWPGISIKIGGSRLFPQRVVTLLLAGIHFSEIPARLRDTNKPGFARWLCRFLVPEADRSTISMTY
jgi:hypothetical protein